MKLNTKMPIITVPVKKGQRLSEVKQIYPLPTNGIFHKRLPGLGATYGEIIAPRHSIIVLPNLPVIEDKTTKHNKQNPFNKAILGVYKGITKEDIIAYLCKETITYKKILITPESYDHKFREAVKDIWDHMKREYYLLIDECERAIQDIDFREKISAPFDDFFSFTNKGLISATTLPFSDPRFEQEEFSHYVIEPNWNYRQPLFLIPTNNVVAATRDYFAKKESHCYFIFLSSISAMTALIDTLNLKSTSKIHCSENRVSEMKKRGYKAESTLDINNLVTYNFFTSRYYSAIDIELDFKPDVLLLTEVIFAEHSILDPHTEVIQIVGRFRNGTKSITHISNVNPKIQYRGEEAARIYMEGQKDMFNQIIKLKNQTDNEGGQEMLRFILTESKFARYFKPCGSFNYFMLDNYIQEQRVLGIYKDFPSLINAYKEVDKHFNPDVNTRIYALDDRDRLRRETIEGRKAMLMEVTAQLEKLEIKPGTYFLGDRYAEIRELKKFAPVIVEAYPIIGREGIENAEYSESRIRAAVTKELHYRQLSDPRLLIDVFARFKTGDRPAEMFITTTLQDIYDRHNVKQRARATDIKKYFRAMRTSAGSGANKVYQLFEARKFDHLEKIIAF